MNLLFDVRLEFGAWHWRFSQDVPLVHLACIWPLMPGKELKLILIVSSLGDFFFFFWSLLCKELELGISPGLALLLLVFCFTALFSECLVCSLSSALPEALLTQPVPTAPFQLSINSHYTAL